MWGTYSHRGYLLLTNIDLLMRFLFLSAKKQLFEIYFIINLKHIILEDRILIIYWFTSTIGMTAQCVFLDILNFNTY